MEKIRIDRKKVWQALKDKLINETMACSIIAHGRGKTHGTKRRVVYYNFPKDSGFNLQNSYGGSRILDLDLDLQLHLINKALERICKFENVIVEGKSIGITRSTIISLSLNDFKKDE